MSLVFNAEEILEIACQIERNGARYYRRAAQLVADRDAGKMLEELAVMEEGHEIAFSNMMGDPDILSRLLGDMEGPTVLYLRALAGGRVFRKDSDPAAELMEGVEISAVLERAIEMELKSIAFYEGVREQMPPEKGRDKITAIIHEEMSHVALLVKRLDESGD